MKKIVLAACLLTSLSAKAQFIEAGVHVGYGTTWLINNNVSDQGANLDPATSFGTTFGIHGGYYFPSRLGIVVEIDYAIVNQKYTGKNSFLSYDVKDRLNFIELPILLRKYSPGGFYFEVGPKFSFLTGATETLESSPAFPLDYEDRDIAAGHTKTIVSAAFGIGGHFPIGKNLYADARLRFAYGFSDATVKFSEAELTQKTLEQEIGVGTYYAHRTQQGQYSYKNTNLATGHVMAGLSYRIPAQKKSSAIR